MRMPSLNDPAIDTQAFWLMRDLVLLTGEKWVAASQFSAMADRWGVTELQARINFMTAIKTLLRGMPVKVFSDADARQSLLNAVQEALDREIALEEGGPPDELG